MFNFGRNLFDSGRLRITLFDKSTQWEKSIDIQFADYTVNAIDIFTFLQLNDTLKIQTLLDSDTRKNSFWFRFTFFESLGLYKVDLKLFLLKVISFLKKQKGEQLNCKTSTTIVEQSSDYMVAKVTQEFEGFTKIDLITLINDGGNWKISQSINTYK